MDSQTHATDDPLHAARHAVGDPAAAAALLRLPRQGGAHPRQHGGQRTLLSRAGRREKPPLRRLSVALPPDRPARRRVRGGARLVVRVRISAGAGARVRRLRGSADDGLFRAGAGERAERDLLGLGRADGVGRADRHAFRTRPDAPHAQNRLPQHAAPLGPAVRHPAARRR